MPKPKNPLGVKEVRLTPKQYEDALVKYAKLPADTVDEKEYRKRLRDTAIYRYKIASELLADVGSVIKKMPEEANEIDRKDLNFAIKKIDLAVVQMTHASLGFNKAATAGARNLLKVKRPRARKS